MYSKSIRNDCAALQEKRPKSPLKTKENDNQRKLY